MRIVHVIDYFHTDVLYQEYYLAMSMAGTGHTVTVVSSGLRQHTVAEAVDDGGSGERELREAGISLVRLPARQLGHDRTWMNGLAATLRELHADVVHCHGPFSPTTVRVAWACRRNETALLVDNHMHEAIAPSASSPQGRAFYRAFRLTCGPLLRSAVGDWVANGPYEASFLERRLGLPAGTVGLVPLGFDPSIFHPDAKAAAHVRAEHGWADDVVVAVTGKIHGGKRPELAAAACERALTDRPVRLVIAGSVDPISERAISAAAPDLFAEGRTTRLPMLDRRRLAGLFQASDVVVFARLPSISIYEAAGTGARVVCGRDDFSDWLAGFGPSIESVEPVSFADHLLRPEDREESAHRAGQAFAWPIISEEFVRRYRAIQCGS